MKKAETLFKDLTQEDKMLKAFELFEQVTDSCSKVPDEAIQKKALEFVHFIAREDEPRISLQQNKSLDMNEMNKDFLTLFFLRLQSFQRNNSDIELTRFLFIQTKIAIMTLLEQQDVDSYEIIFTQLINFSRTLVEDQETVMQARKFLACLPTKYSLTDPQNELFKIAFSLYQELLKTPLVKWALNEVLKHPSYEKMKEFTADKMLEIFKNMKITWVQHAFYYGMVGLNGIFLDEEIFRKSEPGWTVSKIIGECFREGFNFAERVLRQNFAVMTPISQDSEHLEGGFLFEKYIWGNFDIVYWGEELSGSVLDIKRWQKESSLFTDEERKKAEKKSVQFPICSGLCTESKCKDEM